VERPLKVETLISGSSHRGGPVGIFLSNIPDGLRYTKDHEWAKLEGTRARIGITDHAQSELTDVVYVELPPIGKVVRQGEPMGTVESVKAVSEIFAPAGGKVIEVNKALIEQPELVNKDPYGLGWMVVLEVTDPTQANGLMDAAAYRRHIGE
jgi:glycine cleavage system H protein